MSDTVAGAEPVIIEAAVDGQTTKAVNPNIPRSGPEIAASSLRCLEAGAALIYTPGCKPR